MLLFASFHTETLTSQNNTFSGEGLTTHVISFLQQEQDAEIECIQESVLECEYKCFISKNININQEV